MRKTYEKPEISVVEVTICSVLSTSFNIDSNSRGDFREDFARKHRGTWGDLWEEKESIQ